MKKLIFFFLMFPLICRSRFSLLRIFTFPYFSVILHTNSPSDCLHGSCDVARISLVKCRHQMTSYLNVYKFNSMQESTTLSRCLVFVGFFFLNPSLCRNFLIQKASLDDHMHQSEFWQIGGVALKIFFACIRENMNKK